MSATTPRDEAAALEALAARLARDIADKRRLLAAIGQAR
jgi:hypothetical protein